MLYRVLKAGLAQRDSEGGWQRPKVGDVVTVSDVAAPRLIARGFIETSGGGHVADAPKKKAKKERFAWGDAPDEPKAEPAPEGETE